jgi:hypothetical protein
MAIIPSYSDCQKNINECEKSQTELIGPRNWGLSPISEILNIEMQLLYLLLDYMHNCAYNIKMEFEG